MNASRTLVVLPNWVGDSVMAIPVLEALAETGRQLTALAKPHLEPLIELIPAVASVVVRQSSNRRTVAALHAEGFEEAVVLPNSFRSAWIPFRAGIPVRWGFRGDFRNPLLEPGLTRPDGLRHQVADYDALLERLGASIPAQPPQLKIGDRLIELGRSELAKANLDVGSDRPIIGLFPGAEFGVSKRWPASFFVELIRSMRGQELQPVVILGPAERPVGDAIREAAAFPVPILGPDLDLAELAGLLHHLRLLVTNDSGPMHIAAAAGVQCIAIFGSTNPVRTAPSGPGHRVLYTGRWCSPCFKRRCPLLHHRCMKDISVDDVREAVAAMLST